MPKTGTLSLLAFRPRKPEIRMRCAEDKPEHLFSILFGSINAVNELKVLKFNDFRSLGLGMSVHAIGITVQQLVR
jgi:hypothetical protein